MDLTRRELLAGCVATLPALAFGAGTPEGQRTLGIVVYCYSIRMSAERAGGAGTGLNDPLAFVEHCHQRGAAGVQLSLGVRDSAYAAKLREKIEALHIYMEGIVRLPQGQSDLERFSREVETAKEAGAKILRTVLLNTRRYETFETAAAFRGWSERAWQALTLAEPVMARLYMRLAVENHKDLRVQE